MYSHIFLYNTGYLACARCSSTGALVLTEPVSAIAGGNHSLSPPKTERCSNCSGAGKVKHTKTKTYKTQNLKVWILSCMCLMLR